MVPPHHRTTPVHWSVQAVSVAGQTISVARLEVTLFFASSQPGLQFISETGWLDTGAPVTVVPHHIHHGRLAWQPLGAQTTWAQQDCDLGAIEVWLPGTQGAAVEGPFSLLAKFARSDPPGGPVPLLIGLEFLLSIGGSLWLPQPPQPGEVRYS